MSGKIINFDEKKIRKSDFYKNKNINRKSDFYKNKKINRIDDINVNNILVSKKEPCGTKN